MEPETTNDDANTTPAAEIKAGAKLKPGEAVLWLRMCDADLERYGGPEWAGFDLGKLYNAPSSVLEELEDEIPIPLANLIFLLPGLGARVTRTVLFVARRMAGVKETWAAFDPITMQVKRREQPADKPLETGAKVAGGRGKSPARPRSATSRRGSAGAQSAKSSTN